MTASPDDIKLDLKKCQILNLGFKPFQKFLRKARAVCRGKKLTIVVGMVEWEGHVNALFFGAHTHIFLIEMKGGKTYHEHLKEDIRQVLTDPNVAKVCFNKNVVEKMFFAVFGFRLNGLNDFGCAMDLNSFLDSFSTVCGFDLLKVQAFFNDAQETRSNLVFGISDKELPYIGFWCYVLYTYNSVFDPSDLSRAVTVSVASNLSKTNTEPEQVHFQQYMDVDQENIPENNQQIIEEPQRKERIKRVASLRTTTIKVASLRQIEDVLKTWLYSSRKDNVPAFSFGVIGQVGSLVLMYLCYKSETLILEANLKIPLVDNFPKLFLDILQDDSIMKICLNVRMTSLVVFQLFGITMGGIINIKRMEYPKQLASLFGNEFGYDVNELFRKVEEAESLDLKYNYSQVWEPNSPFTLIAHMAYVCGMMSFNDSTIVSLKEKPRWILDMLAETWLSTTEVDNLRNKNFFAEFASYEYVKNTLVIHQKHYKSRIRPVHRLEIIGYEGNIQAGWSDKRDFFVDGKKVILKNVENFKIGHLRQIKVDASDDHSKEIDNLKKITDDIMSGVLNIEDNMFLRVLFDRDQRLLENRMFASMVNTNLSIQSPSVHKKAAFNLNPSQKKAVDAIIAQKGDAKNITLIQGPPGSGKTTVISNAVKLWYRTRERAVGNYSFVCCARTNAAVLNIANALIGTSFTDFIILVSSDYHYDWHEDQYLHLADQLVETSKLETCSNDVYKNSVFLCTIGSLSNYYVTQLFKRKRVRRIVIDEASQVPLASYVYPFLAYQTLTSVAFFGDPKQLAPFGSEQVEIRDVFAIDLLQSKRIFLDVCYRLPHQLASLISANVYDGRLRPFKESSRHAVYWVDVQGMEEIHKARIKNRLEAKMIVQLISNQFRKCLDRLVIITPYDAQRQYLVEMLASYQIEEPEKLVYTIDSYQGHEADIVFVSLVRTRGVGFLVNQRRCNVMLTRCRKTMVILGKLDFVMNSPQLDNSLIRKVAKMCEESKTVLNDINNLLVQTRQ